VLSQVQYLRQADIINLQFHGARVQRQVIGGAPTARRQSQFVVLVALGHGQRPGGH